MEIFAYDYRGIKKVGTIDGDFDYLEVEVISGDELVCAYKNGGVGKHPTYVGSVYGGNACIFESEGSYFVDRGDIDEWLGRRDSYHWLYEDPTAGKETSE